MPEQPIAQESDFARIRLPAPPTHPLGRDASEHRLINQCVDHIMYHRGPDDQGFAHPQRKQITIEQLERALELCHDSGLSDQIRPFFFKGVNGLFKRSECGKELVALSVKGLVDSTYQKLARLVKVATANMLMEPFDVVIDEKKYRLKPASAMSVVAQGSPYKAVRYYLEYEEPRQPGLKERYKNIAPYHFPECAKAYFSSSKEEALQATIERSGALLYRALEQKRRAPGNNLQRVISSLDSDELLVPFIDDLDGEPITVSLHRAVKTFSHNVRSVAQYYLAELRRREPLLHPEIDAIDLDQLLRRSINTLTCVDQGTRAWNMETCWAAMSRRLDLLIERNDGSLAKLMKVVTANDLRKPLPDITERQASLEKPFLAFDQSPFKVISYYIDQRGAREPGFKERFNGLRPYHLAACSLEFYSKSIDGVVHYNVENCREVAFKKIDQLIAGDQHIEGKYGSLRNLICNLDHADLMAPLLETIDGEIFEVATAQAFRGIGTTVFDILRAYIDHRSLADPSLVERYKNFRKYHLKRSTRGCFSETIDGQTEYDEETSRELVSRKVQELLDTKYSDLVGLMSETSHEELKEPLHDTLDGMTVEISMASALQTFENKLWKILQQYHLDRGMPFAYTRLCFVGPPEARRRRILGELSSSDIRKVTLESGEIDTRRYGFKRFDGVDKAGVRELIFEFAKDYLPRTGVRYLGLETEIFDGVRTAQRYASISSVTIIERDRRVVAAMESISKISDIFDGVDRVTVRSGDVNAVLGELQDKFDLCYLDYVGHLSKGKERGIRSLLENNSLGPSAVVFITLQDSALARSRMLRAGYGADSYQNVTEIVRDAAKDRYNILDSFSLDYPGGINSAEGNGMVCCGYALERLEAREQETASPGSKISW